MRLPGNRAAARSCALGLVWLALPLDLDSGWHALRFDGRRPHAIVETGESLEFHVDSSAGGLVRLLRDRPLVSGLRVRGQVIGSLAVAAGDQGREGFDDYALRAGLVEAGRRRPGLWARLMAPRWLREVYGRLERHEGIEAVHFYVLALTDGQLGAERQHPLHPLLRERIVAAPAADGGFDLRVEVDPPLRALGVWLNVDGDDTASRFRLRISTLQIGVQDGETAQLR